MKEIECYFTTAPERSVPLGKHGVVLHSKAGANALIGVLKANSGNKAFMPYWHKLVMIYNACKEQDNAVNELLANG